MYAYEEDWRRGAKCVGLTDVMFPEDEAGEAAAKAVCAGCPVREECLADALARGEKDGVWGGRTEAERARIVRDARKAIRRVA